MNKVKKILFALVSWIPGLFGSKKRLLKFFGYPAFASLCFTVALVFTFPTEQVKARIVDEASKRQNMNISIGELGLNFPLGVEARDVVIADKPNSPHPNHLLPMKIQYMEASLSPMAGLNGEIEGDATVEIYGGVIESQFRINQEQQRYVVKLDAKGLHFESNPSLQAHLPDLPIKGRIDLDYDLDLDLKDIKRSKGTGEIKMFGVVLGPGKMEVPVPGMSTMNLDLPEVNLGKLITAIEIKDSKIDFTRWEHEKTDIETDSTGSVRLRTPLGRSVANINFRFKISESLLKSNDLFQIALSANKSAEGADGFYYFTMKGSLENPVWQKNRAAELKFRPKGKRQEQKKTKLERRKPKTPRKATPKKPKARKASKDYGKKDSSSTKVRSRLKNKTRDRLTKDLTNSKKSDEPTVEEDEEELVEDDAVEEEDTIEEEDTAVEEEDGAVEEEDATDEGAEEGTDEGTEDEADKTKEIQGEE